MKKIMLFLVIGLLLQAPIVAEAQILKKVVKKVKKKTKEEVEKKAEKEVGKVFEEKRGDSIPKEIQAKEKEGVQEPVLVSQEPQLVWAKYDFVPGEHIIFEDNQENEENGEFPSRWDLKEGNVENAVFGDEKVIMFRGGFPLIIPYLKNPEKDYLPDVFTVEFDLFLPDRNYFTVFFYDRKNQRTPSNSVTAKLLIRPESMELRPAKSSIPDKGSIQNQWAHISIAHTKGKMKAYIDDTRLINIPHLDYNPTGISLHAYFAKDDRRYYIKNFR